MNLKEKSLCRSENKTTQGTGSTDRPGASHLVGISDLRVLRAQEERHDAALMGKGRLQLAGPGLGQRQGLTTYQSQISKSGVRTRLF